VSSFKKNSFLRLCGDIFQNAESGVFVGDYSLAASLSVLKVSSFPLIIITDFYQLNLISLRYSAFFFFNWSRAIRDCSFSPELDLEIYWL